MGHKTRFVFGEPGLIDFFHHNSGPGEGMLFFPIKRRFGILVGACHDEFYFSVVGYLFIVGLH